MTSPVQPGNRCFGRASVLLAAIALVSVGCGSTGNSASTGDEVASIDGSRPDDASVASDATGAADEVEAPDNIEDAALLFNDCMAEAGFEMGEVIMGTADEGELGVSIESDDDADFEEFPSRDLDDFEGFEAAAAQCERHFDNADVVTELNAEQEAAFEDAQREWADCMSDQGFEIPDFSFDDTSIAIEVDGAEQGGFELDEQEFERFEEADRICAAAFDDIDFVAGP